MDGAVQAQAQAQDNPRIVCWFGLDSTTSSVVGFGVSWDGDGSVFLMRFDWGLLIVGLLRPFRHCCGRRNRVVLTECSL